MTDDRMTYEQLQRALRQMPDLVDIIRLLRPQVEAVQADGRNVRHDRVKGDKIGFHWDRGN